MKTKISDTSKKDIKLVTVGSDTFYDDCPVCRAMKKAEEEGRPVTEKELMEAFNESEKQGAVVGGLGVGESTKNPQ